MDQLFAGRLLAEIPSRGGIKQFIFAHRQLWEYFAAHWMFLNHGSMRGKVKQTFEHTRWEEINRLFMSMLAESDAKFFFSKMLDEDFVQALRVLPECRSLTEPRIREEMERQDARVRIRNIKELGRRNRSGILDDNVTLDVLDQLLKGGPKSVEAQPPSITADPNQSLDYIQDVPDAVYRETNGEVLYFAIRLLERIGAQGAQPKAWLILCRRFRTARQQRRLSGSRWMASQLLQSPEWSWIVGHAGESGVKFEFGGKPVHVDDFFMMRHEVSNQQYEAFDPPHWRDRDPALRQHRDAGRFPVTSVNWFEAWSYAYKRGVRLPTEVQWEYAASWNGLKQNVYPWGDEFDPLACNCAAFEGVKEFNVVRCDELTHRPSSFGITNMAGNVWEWCAEATTDGTNFESEAQWWADITAGDQHAVRGGCFFDPADQMACKHSETKHASHRDPDFGFRCVVDASQIEWDIPQMRPIVSDD